jgi:hypothetical protein
MAWLILLLLMAVAIHAFLSLRYNYDWIGSNVRKFVGTRAGSDSVTELYDIPAVPYMDRFESFTRIPKMKENVRY